MTSRTAPRGCSWSLPCRYAGERSLEAYSLFFFIFTMYSCWTGQANVIMFFQEAIPTSLPLTLSLRKLSALCEVEEDELLTTGVHYCCGRSPRRWAKAVGRRHPVVVRRIWATKKDPSASSRWLRSRRGWRPQTPL